jgi:hypothetical protein
VQAAKQKEAEDAAAAAANQPFDHFMGNDTGAFAYGDYDEDDREADETYAKIEDIMDERRKVPALHISTQLRSTSEGNPGACAVVRNSVPSPLFAQCFILAVLPTPYLLRAQCIEHGVKGDMPSVSQVPQPETCPGLGSRA